jgi:hypothetical protein
VEVLSCHPEIPYLKSSSVIVLLMSRLPFRFAGIAKEAKNERSKASSTFHSGGSLPGGWSHSRLKGPSTSGRHG